MGMDRLWYLSQISMLDTLPLEDLQELDRTITHTLVRKKQIVQTPDTFCEGLYFIKQGKIRLFKINPEGKQFTVGILGTGNVYGEVDSFSLGTRDVFVETMEETMLCSMSKSLFDSFLAERPQLMLKLLQELSRRLQERDELLVKMALGNVQERLLHLLVKLAEQFGKSEGHLCVIDLPLTHQELANMIGATRETVTLTLNELVKAQLIRFDRRMVQVDLDRAALYGI